MHIDLKCSYCRLKFGKNITLNINKVTCPRCLQDIDISGDMQKIRDFAQRNKLHPRVLHLPEHKDTLLLLLRDSGLTAYSLCKYLEIERSVFLKWVNGEPIPEQYHEPLIKYLGLECN